MKIDKRKIPFAIFVIFIFAGIMALNTYLKNKEERLRIKVIQQVVEQTVKKYYHCQN